MPKPKNAQTEPNVQNTQAVTPAQAEAPAPKRTRRRKEKAKDEAQGITPEHVLHELAAIAFAVPDNPDGPAVKMADKLRALEMIYKHLGMAEAAGTEEGVIIIDGE